MFVGVQGSLEEIEDTAQYTSYKVFRYTKYYYCKC